MLTGSNNGNAGKYCICMSRPVGILLTLGFELIVCTLFAYYTFIFKDYFNTQPRGLSKTMDFIAIHFYLLMTIVSGVSSIFGIIGLCFNKLFGYKVFGIISIMLIIVLSVPGIIFTIATVKLMYNHDRDSAIFLIFPVSSFFLTMLLLIYGVYNLQKFLNERYYDQNKMTIYGLSASLLLWPFTLIYGCCVHCCCKRKERRKKAFKVFIASIIIGIICYLIPIVWMFLPESSHTTQTSADRSYPNVHE